MSFKRRISLYLGSFNLLNFPDEPISTIIIPRKIIFQFNGTLGQKKGLIAEIRAIKQHILEQLPDSENKSWVKKLSAQLTSLEEMQCTQS